MKTGIIGAGIAAVCCFTPILVIGLGAVGLSTWLGWLGYVLLPALVLFVGLAAWSLWRRQKAGACCAEESPLKK